MAISSTRVKFLDKENKVLVKGLGDIVGNTVLSDFITPLTELGFLTQLQGSQLLSSVQNGISLLTNELSDLAVSKFSIDKIIAAIDLADPALANLAATLTALKTLPDAAVNLFMTSLLDVTADALYDNPSLLNLYQDVSEDASVQLVLTSLSIFSSKLQSGALTMSNVTKNILADIQEETGVTGTDFDNVLGVINSNKTALNLNTSIVSNKQIPATFFDEITTDDSSPIVSVSGGAVYSGNGFTFEDPYHNDLLIAYVSLKKAYYSIFLIRRGLQIASESILKEVVTPYSTATAAKNFYTDMGARSFIAPKQYVESMLFYIYTSLVDILVQRPGVSAKPLSVLVYYKDLFISLSSTALTHPYLSYVTGKYADCFDHVESSISEFCTNVADGDTITSSVTNDFYYKELDALNLSILNHVKNVNDTVSVDNLFIPIAITKCMMINKILKSIDVGSESSHLAAMELLKVVTNGMNVKVTSALDSVILRKDVIYVLDVENPVNNVVTDLFPVFKAVSAAIKASDVYTFSATETAYSKKVRTSLFYFANKLDLFLKDFTNESDFQAYFVTETMYTVMVDNSRWNGFTALSTLFEDLDKEDYCVRALPVTRLAFTGNKIRIT